MKRKVFKNGPKLQKLADFAITIQHGDGPAISKHLLQLQTDDAFQGTGWQTAFNKLADVMADQQPRFSIFALGGNSKLPFVAFSTLPGVTCPGAGDCMDFCYSYRAWRYPAAFARMAQNAWLLRFSPDTIAAAFQAITAQRPAGFDFRLYVDGDFSSVEDLHFWMQQLKAAPAVRAYGYSKSFAVLLGYDLVIKSAWPENYMLNISSGHNASHAMVTAVKTLPIVRGEFIAVSIGEKVKSSQHGTPAINAKLRAAFPDQKIFPCPGTCGTCTGAGHACGLPQMKYRTIAIAMH